MWVCLAYLKDLMRSMSPAAEVGRKVNLGDGYVSSGKMENGKFSGLRQLRQRI